jgi:hypothetical protein
MPKQKFRTDSSAWRFWRGVNFVWLLWALQGYAVQEISVITAASLKIRGDAQESAKSLSTLLYFGSFVEILSRHEAQPSWVRIKSLEKPQAEGWVQAQYILRLSIDTYSSLIQRIRGLIDLWMQKAFVIQQLMATPAQAISKTNLTAKDYALAMIVSVRKPSLPHLRLMLCEAFSQAPTYRPQWIRVANLVILNEIVTSANMTKILACTQKGEAASQILKLQNAQVIFQAYKELWPILYSD